MPELRKDAIVDRWVIIATERSRRPNDFLIEPEPPAVASPFAAGHEARTPPEIFQIGRDPSAAPDTPGWQVRVVPNKYPALSMEGELNYQGLGMFDLMNGVGAHEVVIENPDQNWDMTVATDEEMTNVLRAYRARILALQQDERFRYVLVFRNKGTMAGATIAHPHSQIIALPILPMTVKEHLTAAREYYQRKSRCIFTDILRQELALGDRIVEANEHFIVLCPFAARFPFETQIYPRRQSHDFATLDEDELRALGDTLRRTLRRIKTLLGDPAYNLMLHNSPNLSPQPGCPDYWGTIAQDYQWRLDILPRLTRVAGFEWGTGFYINPVAPEEAARFLRETATA